MDEVSARICFQIPAVRYLQAGFANSFAIIAAQRLLDAPPVLSVFCYALSPPVVLPFQSGGVLPLFMPSPDAPALCLFVLPQQMPGGSRLMMTDDFGKGPCARILLCKHGF